MDLKKIVIQKHEMPETEILGELLVKHRPVILAILRKKDTLGRVDKDDFVHDVVLAAWYRMQMYGETRLYYLICSIASRLASKRIKGNYRDPIEIVENTYDRETGEFKPVDGDMVEDESIEIERLEYHISAYSAIEKFRDRLTNLEAYLVGQILLKKKKIVDVARSLNRDPRYIKAVYKRALKKLNEYADELR